MQSTNKRGKPIIVKLFQNVKLLNQKFIIPCLSHSNKPRIFKRLLNILEQTELAIYTTQIKRLQNVTPYDV